MATGFGLLRLSPAAFWMMTPREMERAMSVLNRGPDGPPRKAQLAALMTMFPDGLEAGHG
ncbi:phage tail assembly chaperone [Mesorhizobium sp. ANAO-SY3R2]|uniref:phage tail assembly chaperone n=1 Tax=Mesorhizobium sp. ANAO-SY3R2 TaxID=3166644 RepID=UPI0036732672